MKASVKILKRRLDDNKKRIDRLKKELSLAELDRKKTQSELKSCCKKRVFKIKTGGFVFSGGVYDGKKAE